MPDNKTDRLEEFVNQSADALTSALLIDFPGSEAQSVLVRTLIKEAVMERLSILIFDFMVEDILPILFKVKKYDEGETDAG